MSARPKEPSTAPQAEHWYPLVLGSSLKDQPSKRFYSLRYEFKPASIDTSRPGALHKGAENKVTVELSNNQPGKPKVSFQGISEDCKDSDAILFFDGRTFRLERLHRAVKALRHVRQPGESASAAALNSGGGAETSRSPLHLNGTNGDDSNVYRGPREHVEEIVIGGQPDAGTSGSKKNDKKPADNNRKGKTKASSPANVAPAPTTSTSSDRKRGHAEGSPPLFDETTAIENSKKLKPAPQDNVEHIDINIDDDGGGAEHESDYELEDVDVSEDEDGQVNTKLAADNNNNNNMNNNSNSNNAGAKSSSSSGSSSSDSGSGSSSDSDGSDDESASLGEI